MTELVSGPADQSAHPLAQVVAILIILVVVGGLSFTTRGKLRGVFMGKDKRMSTSKTTALLWTIFIAWAFLTEVLVALKYHGSALSELENQLKPIPSNTYLLLLGGPFAALIAAKGIVTSRLANGTLPSAPIRTRRTTGSPSSCPCRCAAPPPSR